MPAEAESIGFLLARIHNNMDRQANNNLKSSGMTFSQMRILYYLLKHGEAPPSQKDIEDFLQVSHPTVVGLIKRLEAKGLIRCAPSERDRRYKRVCCTEQSAGIHKLILSQDAEVFDALCHDLSPEQRAQLVELADLLLRGIDLQ